MSDEKASKIFSGSILIVLGILLLLRNIGVVNFSIIEGLKRFWPILIILLGISFIIKAKGFFSTVVVVILILIGVNFLSPIQIGEMRNIIQEIEDENFEIIALDLNYGAGELNIESSEDTKFAYQNSIKTADTENPELELTKDGSNAKIYVSREIGSFSFWRNSESVWDVKLSSEPEYKIDLNYGGSNVDMSLQNLKVSVLAIDSGATNTEIKFERFPTRTKISTGASSFMFEIPENYGAKIITSGGLISHELDGFKEDKPNVYTNPAYDPTTDNIIIEIDAGATSIKTRLY